MTTLRLVVVAVVAILAIVVIVQNTESVETRLLFLSITMPRALLLLVTLLVGFVLGIVAAAFFDSPMRRLRGND